MKRRSALSTAPALLVAGALVGLAAPGRTANEARASDPSESIGEIVFECYSINFAWGHRHSGYYVDRHGGVHRYDRSGDLWLPESVQRGDALTPEADLLEKFKTAERYREVSPQLLNEKIRLLGRAAHGRITSEHEMADAGGHGCVGYLYDSEKALYRSIPLGSGGDIRVTNSAPEARKLKEWLEELRPPRPTAPPS